MNYTPPSLAPIAGVTFPIRPFFNQKFGFIFSSALLVMYSESD